MNLNREIVQLKEELETKSKTVERLNELQKAKQNNKTSVDWKQLESNYIDVCFVVCNGGNY